MSGMTHADLVDLIFLRCKDLGLRYHYCPDARHCQGQPGWLDLTIVGKWVLYREVKSEDGRATRAQLDTLGWLRRARCNVGIWRPEDWESGLIARELEEIA
jgi:hypothetical protein